MAGSVQHNATIILRLPAKTRKRLRQMAGQHGSLSAVVRMLLDEALAARGKVVDTPETEPLSADPWDHL